MKQKLNWYAVAIFFFIVGNTGCAKADNPEGLEQDTLKYYNNSVGLVPDCADPYILNHEGSYYLYGTGGKKGIRVYKSDDLANWSQAIGANDGFALDSTDVWGNHSFWAPEVYHLNNRFYMFYSAMEHLCIAESNSPLGPFIQNEKKPLHSDIKEIDSHLFVDSDGRKFMYFVRFSNGNEIWMAEMKNDLSSIKEETLTRCFGVSQAWERTAKEPVARVAEGPFVLKHNDLYYLFYSANHFRSQDYAVGYAISESPYGPFKKYEGNPVLVGDGQTIFGTGHHSFFYSNSGQMYIVYHSHKSGNEVQPRTTCLDRCGFEKDVPGKPDKFVVNGPSTGNQVIK